MYAAFDSLQREAVALSRQVRASAGGADMRALVRAAELRALVDGVGMSLAQLRESANICKATRFIDPGRVTAASTQLVRASAACRRSSVDPAHIVGIADAARELEATSGVIVGKVASATSRLPRPRSWWRRIVRRA